MTDININPLLIQRTTINPYRHAATMVLNRIQWDLSFESWLSRQKLKNCRDKFKGQKAVIVCNGPSLLKSDLSLLNGVFTFGLNKINLLFEKNNFRPSCIVSVNRLVIEQNRDFFNTTNIPLYLDSCATKFIDKSPNVTFLHSSFYPRFARDCSISIYQGYTVTFVAMQLAFHMGFTDVALVGCDHSFSSKGPANMTVVSGPRDENHFDPSYFSGGMKWQLPDLAMSELFYKLAKDVFDAYGRRIINCTNGGKLEVFPRQELAKWLLLDSL
jgi:hypothetical protein